MQSLFKKRMRRRFTAEQGMFIVLSVSGDCKSPETDFVIIALGLRIRCVVGEYKNAPQVKSLFKKGMKRGFTAERGMFIILFRWGIANPPK